jgi:hypothetical protein
MSSRARSNSRSRTPRRAAAAEADAAMAAVVATEQTDEDGQAKQSGLVRRLLTLRVWHVAVGVIGLGTIAVVELHRREHKTANVNAWHALLAFFLILNSFIAVMEQHLHVGAALVARRGKMLIKKFQGNELTGAVGWFQTPLTRRNVLHEAWTDMWSTYTLFDPCYNDDGTFGFWIDSGNGVLTLLPSLALLYNLTYDLPAAWGFAPKWMALLSIVIFWTELYGTVLYAWGFFYRAQHKKIGWFNTAVFVACTNGIWFVVPAIGIWLMVRRAGDQLVCAVSPVIQHTPHTNTCFFNTHSVPRALSLDSCLSIDHHHHHHHTAKKIPTRGGSHSTEKEQQQSHDQHTQRSLPCCAQLRRACARRPSGRAATRGRRE